MSENIEIETPATKTFEIKLIESVFEKRNDIISRANKEAKHILQNAEQECLQIKKQAHERAAQTQELTTQALRDRIIGEATLEGRRILIQEREKALSLFYQRVRDRLQEIAEHKIESINFNHILTKLVIEAMIAIAGNTFIAYTNARDREYLQNNLTQITKQVKPKLGHIILQIHNKPIATMGGVIVQNQEGTKIFYNTLESRLETTRKRSEAVVAKILGVL